MLLIIIFSINHQAFNTNIIIFCDATMIRNSISPLDDLFQVGHSNAKKLNFSYRVTHKQHFIFIIQLLLWKLVEMPT